MHIHPHIGLGDLRFGMTSSEIRSLVPEQSRPFFKIMPATGHPTDAFSGLGLHVYYQPDGRCEAFELFTPACPMLYGNVLVGAPFATVRDLLTRWDESAARDDVGMISTALGVSIYCPEADEEESMPVEGVLVFEPGYWERD